jgi:hypothetical protein
MIKSRSFASFQAVVRFVCCASALVLPLLASNDANAQEICGDTTCSKGFVCQSYETGMCATYMLDQSIAPSGKENCTTTTVFECVPGPCNVDLDCADGMLCHESSTTRCTATTRPSCDPSALDCMTGEDVPESCTTTTGKQCVARYNLPCNSANDCGPGFACEEAQSCSCSGPRSGTGTGGSAGSAVGVGATAGSGAVSVGQGGSAGVATGDDAVEPNPDCGCEPAGVFACKLQTLACNADVDCPSGLVCVDNPMSSCAVSSDGTTNCSPVVPDPLRVCRPQSYGVGGGSAMGGVIPTPGDPGDVAGAGDDGEPGTSGPLPAGSLPIGHRGCSVALAPGLDQTGLLSLLLGVGLAFGVRGRRGRK